MTLFIIGLVIGFVIGGMFGLLAAGLMAATGDD